MKRQVKMISRGQKIRLFIVMCILMMSGMLGSVSVKAVELLSIADLYVGNDNMTDIARASEDGCAQITDGKGGTATYCMETNTLTLNNFYLDADPDVRCAIDAYEMGDLTIVLQGKNHVYTTFEPTSWPPESILSTNSNITLKGPGSLEANADITLGAVCRIIDCKITLHSSENGIWGTDYEAEAYIENSEIEVVINNPFPQLYQSAMCFGKLKIRNSILSLTSAAGRPSQDGYLPYLSRALSTLYENGPVDLGPDMVMTDQDGNALIGRKLKDIADQFILVYSVEGKWTPYYGGDADGSYGIIRDNYDNMTTTVVIKSANKESSVNMEKKIEELASMDINTDAYGKQLSECEEDYTKLNEEAKKLVSNQSELTKAREAYEENNQKKAQEVEDKISSIGKVDDNSQEKIKEAQDAYDKLTQAQKDKVTNVGVLESAAGEYEQIVQEKKAQADAEAAKERDKEAEKEAEKETEKKTDKETEKETISNKIGKTKITYIKSKKKRQVTLKWKKDKTCDGYQISYSTDKKFKKNKKTKMVKNKNTYRYTLTKLKSKKVYYIRIRKYRIIGNKKTYGAWSTVKKIRVK